MLQLDLRCISHVAPYGCTVYGAVRKQSLIACPTAQDT